MNMNNRIPPNHPRRPGRQLVRQCAVRRILWALSLILSLFALVACSDQPKVSPVAADAPILCFGDSLTFGTGASPATSYPAVLAELTGRKTVNSGVPGEVSATGLARLPKVLEEVKPGLLILCHGGNDILQRKSMDALKDNLRQMIQLAEGQGVQVVLVAVPEFSLALKPAPLYKELAEERRLPLENKSLARIVTKHSLKSDRVHPNAAGYREMAQAVRKVLKDSGAVP